MRLTRRDFLKTTIASSAACGLAQTAIANTQPAAQRITDTHVYLGHWPNEQLLSEDALKLIEELRRNKISEAWVGSFEGLFHKDIAAVNQRLAAACARVPLAPPVLPSNEQKHSKSESSAHQLAPIERATAGSSSGAMSEPHLIPFGTINPALPDWEEDLRRCHEVFQMPGIRLHPNYHGYTLDDPRFTRVLELAASCGLIVQLVASLPTKPSFLLSPVTNQVDLKPLADKVTANKKLRILIANGYKLAGNGALQSLAKAEHAYFDLGRTTEVADALELIGAVSAERVVFGSGGPLHHIDDAWSKLRKLKLSSAQNQAIATLNASKLVAGDRKEDRQ
jgi:uncharacterized protein